MSITDSIDHSSLRDRIAGSVLTASDAGYDEARALWNGTIDRRPEVIVRCRGVADVVAALAHAREHDLLIAVRGGGHNVAGTAICDDGIVIDLSEMRAVSVDPSARTAWVQAGATWADVDRETQLHRLAVPGGVVSGTGVAGLTLSGGYSSQRRAHGMTIDNLLAVEIVTADGRVLRASDSEHPDLFWALRGGGGNFGVVTAFEYRAYELGPDVMNLHVGYPLERAGEIMRAWRDLVADAPDELTCDFFVWYLPAVEELPEALRGRPYCGLTGMWAGTDLEAGAAAVAPYRELGEPLIDLTGPAPYLEVQQALDAMIPDGIRAYWKSQYLDELADEAIDVAVRFGMDRPSLQSIVVVRHLGGAIARVGADETAFGDRSAQFLFSADALWDDPADDAVNIAWARGLHDAMIPFANGRTYFNFASDLMSEGEAASRATYAETYERLARVKATYDPDERFRVVQAIRAA
jgi:FAD/FMN-containing dehydrogenase